MAVTVKNRITRAIEAFLNRQEKLIRTTLAKIQALYEKNGTEAAFLYHTRKLLDNKKLPPDIRDTIEKMTNLSKARAQDAVISAMQQAINEANAKNDLIEKYIAGSERQRKKIFPKVGPITSVDQFIKRKTDGLTLSDRIWKMSRSYQKAINDTLIAGLDAGTPARELATKIRSSLRFNKYLEHPGRGIYRSPQKNAMRVTRNEINTVYATADHNRWKGNASIIAIEVRISNRHPIFDMCDNLKGEYPKDFKFTGWHVNCLCIAIPKLAPQDQRDQLMDYKLGLTDKPPGFDYVRNIPSKAASWIKDNDKRIKGWKSQPFWVSDNQTRYDAAVKEVSEVRKVMALAKQSGPEVDGVGKEYAKKFNGDLTPINFKQEDSMIRKTRDELGGDVWQLKDGVRNTVVVKNEDLDKAIAEAQQDPRFDKMAGGRVKVQTGPEYYGYRGVITNFVTDNGLTAEMQINTAGMIYAKELKKDALHVIDEATYNRIAKETGLPGGLGHEFYNELRVLAPKILTNTASAAEIEKYYDLVQQSNNYYAKFYKF